MNPTDRLRAAANLMREQHGPEHERHEMWQAMAVWLESEAEAADDLADHFAGMFPPPASGYTSRHALAVANAYMHADALEDAR